MITRYEIENWLLFLEYPKSKTYQDMAKATANLVSTLQRQNADLLSEPSFAAQVFKYEKLYKLLSEVHHALGIPADLIRHIDHDFLPNTKGEKMVNDCRKVVSECLQAYQKTKEALGLNIL